MATKFIVSVRTISDVDALVWWHPDQERLEAVIKQTTPFKIPSDISFIHLKDPNILCHRFFAAGGLTEITIEGDQLTENAVVSSVERWNPTEK